jgi:hypothetical protein
MNFSTLAVAFRRFHRDPLNIALHLLTTPLGLVGFLSLVAKVHPWAGHVLAAVYVLSLLPVLSSRLWLLTMSAMVPLAYLGGHLALGVVGSLALMAAGWTGQSLAHIVSGEATFQSSYEKRPRVVRSFVEHTYLLLPLCIDAAAGARLLQAFLAFCTPRNGLLQTRLDSPSEKADLATLKAWVERQRPAEDTTTHWWLTDLDDAAREAFERIAGSPRIQEMFRTRYGEGRFAVDVVSGMNEVYVASLSHENNSDAVFYTEHIDGPFMVYPLAAVFRCIVAVSENVQIRTCFPMTPTSATWTTGDVGAFDFNREIHKIEHNPGAKNDGLRVTLKLHYCVYPKRLPLYGKLLAFLNTQYDVAARKAFLKSLRPATFVEKALARFILLCTDSYRFLGRYVGGGNIAYLLLLGLLSPFVAAPIFLLGTSFVHYFLYVGTYYTRGDVSFFTFKRNAMLYKALAAAQLAYQYLAHFQVDLVSLALIAAGLGLSGLAARTLGMDRTYFGAELGLCEPRRVSRFPYNLVRHPMIVGNIIALLGFFEMEGFRAAVPYLAPLHIAFYAAHLLQEHFDLHRTVEERSIA